MSEHPWPPPEEWPSHGPLRVWQPTPEQAASILGASGPVRGPVAALLFDAEGLMAVFLAGPDEYRVISSSSIENGDRVVVRGITMFGLSAALIRALGALLPPPAFGAEVRKARRRAARAEAAQGASDLVLAADALRRSAEQGVEGLSADVQRVRALLDRIDRVRRQADAEADVEADAEADVGVEAVDE